MILQAVALLSLLSAIPLVAGGNVAIRIVREASNYGIFGNNFQVHQHERNLVTSAPPEKFSGPSHLRSLVGKCFNFTSSDYRYTLCPFRNITQEEESFRWNAYKGVLGVWQGWEISNGSFASMVYAKGDTCGTSERSVKVTLECGNHNTLLNVSEPERCRYVSRFATPLVCHRDALLVYPRLSPMLRHRWDVAESQRFNDEITEKGYKLELTKVFKDAGFVMSTSKPPPANMEHDSRTTTFASNMFSPFTNVAACSAAYQQLQREVQSLRDSLEVYRRNMSSTIAPSLD